VKTFELKQEALVSEKGECLLGARDLGSHACYMIYGVMKPKEKSRLVKPGVGHEEIVLAMKGDLMVTGFYSGRLREGSAFHVAGNHECYLENVGDFEAVYIVAGGHGAGTRHQEGIEH